MESSRYSLIYSTNNSYIQVNVTGLRIVKSVTGSQSSKYVLYVDGSSRTDQLTFTASGFSISSGLSNYEINSFVPSEYRPVQNLYSSIGRTQHILFYLWNNGTVGLANFTSSTLTNQNASCLIRWEY